MCAGLETLKILEGPNFYSSLQKRTEDFLRPIRKVAAQQSMPIVVQAVGSMFTIFFGVEKVESKENLALLDEERFKHFFRYLFEKRLSLSFSL